MQIVPLAAVPSQTVSVLLNGQACQINVYTNANGLFLDLYVDNTLVIGGAICWDVNLIVRSAYLGFIGDLAFYDTQGTTDPVSTGLGSRYLLLYLAPSDLPASVFA